MYLHLHELVVCSGSNDADDAENGVRQDVMNDVVNEEAENAAVITVQSDVGNGVENSTVNGVWNDVGNGAENGAVNGVWNDAGNRAENGV